MPTDYEKSKKQEADAARSFVRYEKHGNIGHIILDEADYLNPWSDKMAVDFDKAMNEPEEDDDIKVVIIKGAGRAFSAGADLRQVYERYGGKKDVSRRPSQRSRLKIDRYRLAEKQRRVLLFPKVTIAQIHGYCIGLGTYIAYCCDLLYAEETTMIGHTEQRLGFSGTCGVFPILCARVGLTRAMDLMLPGKLITGKEAEQIGLITRATPVGKLEEVVEMRAREVALLPRDGIAIGKATRHIEFERMGLLAAFGEGYVMHSYFTNLRWEPDEYNFVRERSSKGTRQAFKDRDQLWGGVTLRSDALARGEVEE
ncbi:MAG: enoyl-CoA hydratase/isomerase family protein [Chloroflexota bacterium]